MNTEKYISTGLYLTLGAALGAGAAILYAPQSGRETRRDIRHAAAHAWDVTKDSREALEQRIAQTLDSVSAKTAEFVAGGDKLTEIQRKRVSKAIQTAMDDLAYYREQLSKLFQ